MKWKEISKEIFGLVLRVIGLAFLYQGLTAIPNAITSLAPGLRHFYWQNILPAILIVGWPLLVGYWLVRRASRVMDLAYGPDAQPEPRNEGKLFGDPTGRNYP